MQDLYEPIELLEFELDAVAGGNPNSANTVTVSISAIASTVASTVSFAFSNAPATAASIDINNSIS
jgi:hypothetical protein